MQIIEKNVPSLLSWQGNNMDTPRWVNYIFIGVIVTAFIYMWARRYKIAEANDDQKRKFFIFRNTDVMLLVISILWPMLSITKLVGYVLSDYPLQWEHIPLHLCRTHAYLIPLFIMIRKKQWVKYIVIPSLFGAAFGMTFWRIDFNDLTLPINVAAQEMGFTYYRLGIDSLMWWEFWITHLLVAILPTYILIANSVKISWRDMVLSSSIYMVTFVALWITNAVTDSFVDDIRWKTNYFYAGRNNANGYSKVLGPLSVWPYSAASFPAMFIIINAVSYRFSIWISNYRFRENDQFIYKIKSETQMIYEANRENKDVKFWEKPDFY